MNDSNLKENAPSGFDVLDNLTGGWQKGDLIVIGGRPAIGKTALGLVMMRWYYKENIPALYFSLELSQEQLQRRFLELYNGSFNGWEQSNSPIIFDCPPHPSYIEDIFTHLVDILTKHHVKVIIVDYLQLLQTHKQTNDFTEKIDYLLSKLKRIARTLNIPIIAFSQLRPSFYYERGEIEAEEFSLLSRHADVMAFIYRPEYYRIYMDTETNDLCNIMKILVEKNRNGQTGKVRLSCAGLFEI